MSLICSRIAKKSETFFKDKLSLQFFKVLSKVAVAMDSTHVIIDKVEELDGKISFCDS